jgi:hypothetical protein
MGDGLKIVRMVWKIGESAWPYTLGKILSATANFKNLKVMVGARSQTSESGTYLFWALPCSLASSQLSNYSRNLNNVGNHSK